MQTLVQLLESFSNRPDSPCLVYRTGVRRLCCSYGDLHSSALRTAALLEERGVQRGDRVLLWGPNSPAWVSAFFGILARGAVAVPVDFMSGAERARTIASLSGCRILFQSRYKADRLEDGGTILLEELEHLLKGLSPATPAQVNGDDPAEIVYTSGTTGNPKGVVLTHRNLTANLEQINRHLPVVEPHFRFLSVLPLSHMFEQTAGLLTPLCRGASIAYLRTMKPSAIMEALAEEGVQVMVLVPRLLQMLKGGVERELKRKGLEGVFLAILRSRLPEGVRSALLSPVRRRFGSSFRLFVSGGAPLDADLARFWGSLGMRVIEGYGLTETSPVLAAGTLEKNVPGSAGRALPGVELRISGGEIQARGENVFSGYYGNPEATKSAFTEDRWFRTGDMGEIDADGWLRIKGRSKEMIVTGAGVNVYPDDIEPILQRTPGVREACVVGLDRGAGEVVHAVIIPDGSGRRGEEIVAEVNRRLDPLHAVTSFSFWPESEFPKTTTLKVRKFQVKERLQEGRGEAKGGAADPLVEAVARVTGTDAGKIREESFLVADLGLTSIARLELVTFLEQSYRLDLDDSLIGPQTTVAELRQLVERRDIVQTKSRIREWVNSPPLRMVRRLADLLLHYPLFRLFVTLETRGGARLQGVPGPLFFISNHLSYFDQPAIMFSLPAKIRYTTATAAWEEFFFVNFRNGLQKLWKRFAYQYATLFLNVFPLPQTSGFRRSLVYMGRLVDRGVNILIFPEGERSQTGEMLPFQAGLGLMVQELQVPVVPIAIAGLEKVYPRGAALPKRGRVRVVIGEPMVFETESPEEIVSRSREAVARLLEEARRGM